MYRCHPHHRAVNIFQINSSYYIQILIMQLGWKLQHGLEIIFISPDKEPEQ